MTTGGFVLGVRTKRHDKRCALELFRSAHRRGEVLNGPGEMLKIAGEMIIEQENEQLAKANRYYALVRKKERNAQSG